MAGAGHFDHRSHTPARPLVPVSHLDRILGRPQSRPSCSRSGSRYSLLGFSFIAAALLSFRFANPWSPPLQVRRGLARISELSFSRRLPELVSLVCAAPFAPHRQPRRRAAHDRHCTLSRRRRSQAFTVSSMPAGCASAVFGSAPRPAPQLARPPGSPHQRPAPRQRQWSAALPAASSPWPPPSTTHCLHPRRPLRRNPRRSRQAGRALQRSCSTLRRLLFYRQP